DAGPDADDDRPANGRRAGDRRRANRCYAGENIERAAPQGADRVSEPVWLAEPAAEDRGCSRGAAASQYRHAGGRTARCGARDAREGRVEAGALRSLSTHVLRWPAPEDRDRPGDHPEAEAACA